MFYIEKEILSDKSVVFNLIIKDTKGKVIYIDSSCTSKIEAQARLNILNTFSFEGV